jgi:hypothetical protein
MKTKKPKKTGKAAVTVVGSGKNPKDYEMFFDSFHADEKPLLIPEHEYGLMCTVIVALIKRVPAEQIVITPKEIDALEKLDLEHLRLDYKDDDGNLVVRVVRTDGPEDDTTTA